MIAAALGLRRNDSNLTALAPIVAGYAIVLTALALVTLAFITIWRTGRQGLGIAMQAGVLSLLLLAPAAYGAYQVLTLPNLTDISTDSAEPPAFSRSNIALTARHGRIPPDCTAEQRLLQQLAYPKTLPIALDLPAGAAFDLARRAARASGWQVLEASRPGGRIGTGRIEAIAKGRFLGLTEDITIRIRPRIGGTRIDIRSASRLPTHDLGMNARNIARFTTALEDLSDTRN